MMSFDWITSTRLASFAHVRQRVFCMFGHVWHLCNTCVTCVDLCCKGYFYLLLSEVPFILARFYAPIFGIYLFSSTCRRSGEGVVSGRL